MKKISSYDISIILLYIFQAFLYVIFLNKSISLTSYSFIIFLVLSIFLGISIIMLFSYLFNLSNKNIFENIKSKFIVLILIMIVFIFACFSIRLTSNYISFIYLKDMNIFIIMITLLVAVFFLIKKDIYSFFRCSTLIFYFYILLELISFILLCFNLKYINLLPISFNLENILDHSYIYLFLIVPILFLLIIPKRIIDNKKMFNKRIFITYFIISIIIFIKSIMSISILGYNSITIYEYIDVVLYKNINLFTFIERIEWLLCFNSITNMFFLISLSAFYIKEGLNYILPIKKNISYVYPLCICIFILLFSYFYKIDFINLVYSLVVFFLIHLTFCLFKLLK